VSLEGTLIAIWTHIVAQNPACTRLGSLGLVLTVPHRTHGPGTEEEREKEKQELQACANNSQGNLYHVSDACVQASVPRQRGSCQKQAARQAVPWTGVCWTRLLAGTDACAAKASCS
jgi:hypothetical protein